MLATFRSGSPGLTEAELVERLRIEQSQRGLIFDYALVTSGLKFGRAPSSRPWSSGEVLSLDTAGYRHGYLADMARMAVLGQPTQLMQDLLDEIRFVQDQARVAVAPGRVAMRFTRRVMRPLKNVSSGKVLALSRMAWALSVMKRLGYGTMTRLDMKGHMPNARSNQEWFYPLKPASNILKPAL
jgi:Xaa-Pro aminopeptidase